MRLIRLRLVLATLAVALVAAACADPEESGADGGPAEGGADGETITMARADWDTGFMQAAIYQQLLQELGYNATDPAAETRSAATFYPALANGTLDLWANGWFPLHDIYLSREQFTGNVVEEPVEPVGTQVSAGAIQGYLVDKATADELGLTSMSAFEDAEVAARFDRDGDGLADLLGCNDGWGCNLVIQDHLAEFGWGANVEQVVSDYYSLFDEAVAQVEAGDPTLLYTWTPNWTVEQLVPGEDVVWLQSESLESAEGETSVGGLPGCAGGADPCDLGWQVNDIRAVANIDFLDAHPDVRRLLEEVEIPLADIEEQNLRMSLEEDYSNAQIQQDAADWIADHRDLVDGWLETARG